MATRRRGRQRDADALAQLEALVKRVEDEAKANGTLHLFERWKATLAIPGEAPASRHRRREEDVPG